MKFNTNNPNNTAELTFMPGRLGVRSCLANFESESKKRFTLNFRQSELLDAHAPGYQLFESEFL